MPRWSEKVHNFSHIFGQDVVGTDGTAVSVRNALAVPIGSRDVVVPRELKPGRPIRDEGAKATLGPFATALRGFLGADGSLTLQGAGIKLRGTPGSSEAMKEQRITGIGAFQRIWDLFPEFEVTGKALKASVQLREA